MLFHSHGAEKTKNNTLGMRTKMPVAMLPGRDLVFWNRPPRQKTVLPSKYSKFLPILRATLSVLVLAGALASDGLSWGDEATESSFSPPCMLRLAPAWLESPLLGRRKLDRKDRGDLMGVGRFPDDL